MPEVRPEPSAKVERILFVLHVLQLLLGLGVVQPFSSLVSTCCWDAFLAVSAIYHFYKVNFCNEWPALEQAPGARDQRMEDSITSSKYHFNMCTVFLGKPPVPLVIIPEWIVALYHAVNYSGSSFGATRVWQQYGAKLQHILSAYQEQILILSAVAEIAAGFRLLLLMLHHPWKYFVLALAYCGMHLPVRTWMPESAPYHRKVWQVVAIVARPLLQMAPLLEIMIDNLKRFHQWSLVTVVPS
ncbi:g2553 [Coccomyxa viridis]|uniref:G2553 protein n=1 Tax=Coccomyxa viridis TaxID=1274662 RepID=A0ABP1FNM2_9CHLO